MPDQAAVEYALLVSELVTSTVDQATQAGQKMSAGFQWPAGVLAELSRCIARLATARSSADIQEILRIDKAMLASDLLNKQVQIFQRIMPCIELYQAYTMQTAGALAMQQMMRSRAGEGQQEPTLLEILQLLKEGLNSPQGIEDLVGRIQDLDLSGGELIASEVSEEATGARQRMREKAQRLVAQSLQLEPAFRNAGRQLISQIVRAEVGVEDSIWKDQTLARLQGAVRGKVVPLVMAAYSEPDLDQLLESHENIAYRSWQQEGPVLMQSTIAAMIGAAQQQQR